MTTFKIDFQSDLKKMSTGLYNESRMPLNRLLLAKTFDEPVVFHILAARDCGGLNDFITLPLCGRSHNHMPVFSMYEVGNQPMAGSMEELDEILSKAKTRGAPICLKCLEILQNAQNSDGKIKIYL